MTGKQLKQLKQQYFSELNELRNERFDQPEAHRQQLAPQIPEGSDSDHPIKKEHDHWAMAATKIDATQERLKKLCREAPPFAHPVYWAGFVSQGVS